MQSFTSIYAEDSYQNFIVYLRPGTLLPRVKWAAKCEFIQS